MLVSRVLSPPPQPCQGPIDLTNENRETGSPLPGWVDGRHWTDGEVWGGQLGRDKHQPESLIDGKEGVMTEGIDLSKSKEKGAPKGWGGLKQLRMDNQPGVVGRE